MAVLTNICGCCEGISPETPTHLKNRPGLSAIAYRTGKYAQFRESLIAALSDARFPALRALTTRDHDDFTIALLDAWAVVSDVISFYQERIANESYLSTATEQKSVMELARLIGYELRPGVAAGTFLAFTIENTSMAPGQIGASGNIRAKEDPQPSLIPVGTKIQSIPGPDEMPQFFETVEPLEAWADCNAIKPKLGIKQSGLKDNILVLDGISNDLKPNDLLLIIENTESDLKKIAKIVIHENDKTTAVYFDREAQYLPFQEPDLTGSVKNFSTPEKILNQNFANKALPATMSQSVLTGLFQMKKWNLMVFKESLRFSRMETKNEVFVFRKKANVFGYNAQEYYDYYDDAGHLKQNPNVKPWPNTNDKKIYLDSAYEQIEKGGYIAVEKPDNTIKSYTVEEIAIRPHTNFGISAKSTVIKTNPDAIEWGDKSDLGVWRNLTIHVQAEALKLALSPITQPVEGDVLTLNDLYPALKEGRPVILFGEHHNSPGTYITELRYIKELHTVNDDTVIVFDKKLEYTYTRKTLTINANVAFSTHGETVKEVLGHGDAAKVFQKFELKNPPLTFISAATPSGTQTTLEIRVNDILWKEVPSLYGRGPTEKIYITRQDDNAKTRVIFGDGKTGLRLPTGQENIKAVYRKGIGAEGLLRADQLSQLASRPLGVKAVTNPMATTGAEDREHLTDARRNATLTIFTLGRIVSLQDYEDFARAFAGISKSLATMTWSGKQQRIYITIAGENGAPVPSDSNLYKNLLTAIRSSGIPDVPVDLITYTDRYFRVEAKIRVHPDYLQDIVLKKVEEKLIANFSFENRQFGQSVARSQVIATMQSVEGVEAVDLDCFYPFDASTTPEDLIPASMPQPGDEHPQPAELLTIDLQNIKLTPMS
jgi:hypothetical protein